MIASGFRIIEEVLSESECDRLIDVLSAENLGRSRAGVRNLISLPEICALASDERLLDITRSVFGRKLIPYKATLFEKSGKANWLVAWHQDTALPVEESIDADGWGPSSVKNGVKFVHAPTSALSQILALRIHLDPSTKENGPLRIISGSHKSRLESDAEIDQLKNSSEEIQCLTDKGGVIAMIPLILHASSKSIVNDPRRVLHIEYSTSLRIAPNIHLAIS